MAGKHPDENGEHPLIGVAAGCAILGVFVFLIWLVASNRIVYGSLQPALFFGAMWKLWPSDFTFSQWNRVVADVQRFAPRPADVSILAWLTFVSVALRPLMLALMALYLFALIFLARSRQFYMRRFKATELMEVAALRFTGVAPVVAIRKLIAKNKHPLWRRQVTPEEVFLSYKVPAGVRSICPPGTPMVVDGKFNREVASTYFLGLRDAGAGQLPRSTMLGRQVVDLVADANKERSTVFSDRMSAEGKTLLALWAAVAFGGTEGRDEFCKYRDMLNRSAYGSKDGMANLALAQPLYSKYRKNKMLNKVFAIHHWEHTVLFFLLSLAQRKGRFTTAEVLWLRPTNRVMFFALNSRGSYTPHTEAAATFAQQTYESLCAKQGRLPLVRNPSVEGGLMHMIYIDKAVDGLELEYARWADGQDDEDDWWLHSDVWKRTNATLNNEFKQIASTVPVTPMPGVGAGDTAFDRSASQSAADQEAADAAALAAELGRSFGAAKTF